MDRTDAEDEEEENLKNLHGTERGDPSARQRFHNFSYRLVVPRQHKHTPECEVDGCLSNQNILPKKQKFSLPYFIISVSILEVILFLVEGIRLKKYECQSLNMKGPTPRCSELIYNPERRYEAWRYVTYSLVHSGYLHIINNIVIQIVIGIPLEVVHGSLRVGTIYLAGIFTGALATSLTDPLSYLCGASGGVYALLIAHFPTLLLNWREMNSIIEWILHLALLVGGLVSSLYALYSRYLSGNGNSGIGMSAHVGGGVAGFLVGINVLRNFKHVKWEGILRLVCIVTWSLFVLLTVLWNSLTISNYFFPKTDWSSLPGRFCTPSTPQTDCSM